jgi:hypothetical protein
MFLDEKDYADVARVKARRKQRDNDWPFAEGG